MEENLSNISIDWVAIRDEINLERVIRDHGGTVVKGKFLCPAHNDKNPSAALLPKRKKQRWVCYSCGEGGSCIDYIVFSMGLNKTEAAVYLGQNYGVGLSEAEKGDTSLARMLSKNVLNALGLKENPFFSAKEQIHIPPERMGTEWDIESIPRNGYEKDMGSLKLDEDEVKLILRGKCAEYLSKNPENNAETRTIKQLYKKLGPIRSREQVIKQDDYELGA